MIETLTNPTADNIIEGVIEEDSRCWDLEEPSVNWEVTAWPVKGYIPDLDIVEGLPEVYGRSPRFEEDVVDLWEKTFEPDELLGPDALDVIAAVRLDDRQSWKMSYIEFVVESKPGGQKEGARLGFGQLWENGFLTRRTIFKSTSDFIDRALEEYKHSEVSLPYQTAEEFMGLAEKLPDSARASLVEQLPNMSSDSFRAEASYVRIRTALSWLANNKLRRNHPLPDDITYSLKMDPAAVT